MHLEQILDGFQLISRTASEVNRTQRRFLQQCLHSRQGFRQISLA